MAEAEKFLFGVVSINYELTIVYVITPTQKKKKKKKKRKEKKEEESLYHYHLYVNNLKISFYNFILDINIHTILFSNQMIMYFVIYKPHEYHIMFTYMDLPSCSLLLIYDTSIAIPFLSFKPGNNFFVDHVI